MEFKISVDQHDSMKGINGSSSLGTCQLYFKNLNIRKSLLGWNYM